MEIIKARVLGYCMGVRRAVEAAEKAAESPDSSGGKKVYSLGPLIHNDSVLKSLGKKGLEILDESEIENVPENSLVIIRAHGVSPEVYSRLEKRCVEIIDATCPRVKASQKNVRKYSKDGFDVILAGDKNHGEVLGIAGFAEGNFILVENEKDAENLCVSENNAVFLSQTTFSPLEFEKISEVLKRKYKNLKIMNTICPATKALQDSLLELCREVEAVVVVGGKNSANTKRLYETALRNCGSAILIENSSEIPDDFFRFKKVGITAGASTPDYAIEEVVRKLSAENVGRLKMISQ